ncbi:type I polyketide synthase [Mycobacterium aquaticum]|uniref:Polyketide synthase n=1 Tax=Mycobacterium aquaticum TaxID=1927124 RepID=A0A1X0B8S0_9MYCO|nr:type I polyketide synthase [Mycobacterium aquaticum]ORA38609.1 polyketide synthase [Mycobacterium aquaticum]
MVGAGADRRAIIAEALHRIDELTARLAVAERADVEPVAVVGMGCRLPGGVGSADQFWQLLQDGRSGIVPVPGDRWDVEEFYSADPSVPGTICARDGGFLTSWSPDEFDAEFFGIAPREAAAMDPQQRLLLEVAWEALENAGVVAQSIRGTQTGIFVGLTGYDYMLRLTETLRREDYDAYIPFGNAANFAAGRLAYFLGARGPALVVDTACSSSLVSVHLACQSLRRGESDTALAAGVNLILRPENSIACSRFGMLSPDGQCKTFDAGANGYVRSEGCGVVVLKRLSDALADGDRVLAVVRGSAVNQDGASSGQTVPNGPAQQALMRQALAASRLQAADIDYIEAHGTGTALGDPIELDALAQVFADRGDAAPLVVGSVKTNLGHLESAAGIAGFIKTVLSVRYGYIPKHLNFHQLTPHASQDATRLTIASSALEWPTVPRPRRAGVSSFGVSGTNAHIIVEQAPSPEPAVWEPDSPVTTLVVSGKTPERIAATAAMLAQWMTGPGAEVRLADVAHTLNHHRTQHRTFATICARDHDQAVAGLSALAAGQAAVGVVRSHDGPCRPGRVFVYSGQGSQWAGMGRRLLTDEPAFAAAIDTLEPAFRTEVGFSLREVLETAEPLTGIERIQPVLTGLQVALTALWRHYGVVPDAVIGHSMGEVAAAVTAGALTPTEGLRVIATRSRLMSRLAGQGAVALLELDADATSALIAERAGVSLAVYSSPRQTVVAGPPAQIDQLITDLQQQDRFARRVNMEVASHSALMDPILTELRTGLMDLEPKPPAVPFLSTVTNDWAPHVDAAYWVANVRQPVRLYQALADLGEQYGTFIEISPHPVLTHSITETLGDTHHHAVGTLSRDTDDTHTFHTNLNAIHTAAAPQTPHPDGLPPELPTTPWQHTRHWIDGRAVDRPVVAQPSDLLSGAVPPQWCCELTWQVRPLPEDRHASGTWLVVSDAELSLELDATLLAPSALSDDDGALADVLNGVTHVVFAPDVGIGCLDPEPGYHLFNMCRKLCAALALLPEPPRLYLLTRNAQPLSEGDRAHPAHAVLWGLGRTLALEHPEFWGGVIDVDESVPAERVAGYLRAEAAGSDGDDQAVYRAGRRHVPRLVQAPARPAPSAELDGAGSHLVVGATGNIGPHLVRQLVAMGARTVVAVSRNPGSRMTELAQAVAEQGATLVPVAADASDPKAMSALFDRFGRDLPELSGIYLAAFGGGPVTLADMTAEDVQVMFRPKLDAVSLLHTLSLKHPVRQFVLFASISGLLGSRWLAHYTATTAFLDTFAYARRAAGLPATTVNWGWWKSLADNQSDEYQQVTLSSGLEPMPDEVAIRALCPALTTDAPVRAVVAAADWTRLAAAYRTRANLKMVDSLIPAEGAEDRADDDHWAGAPDFTELDPLDAERIIGERLRTRLAAIMGYADQAALSPAVPLIELGMDSLMAVRIRHATQSDFGVEPPVAMLLQGASLDDITADVMHQCGVSTPDTGAAIDALRDRANQRAAARRGAAVRRTRGQRA